MHKMSEHKRPKRILDREPTFPEGQADQLCDGRHTLDNVILEQRFGI